MKLSQLIAYRNALEQLSVPSIQRTTNFELDKIIHLVETQTIQIGSYSQDLKKEYNNLGNQFSQFDQKLQSLRQSVEDMIEAAERPWFQESYRLYDQEMRNDTVEYILNRRMNLNEPALNTMNARIQRYSDWKHPAMIIRPGLDHWIEHMVAFDPLYLVDQDIKLLLPASEKFTIEYQRRLRKYSIKEVPDSEFLQPIPNNQLGLCFAYNFFNFKPFEVLKQYLTEIYTKLKPGGTLILTFNDCDRDKAVMLVEQHFCCYTPGKMVRQLAESIGYQHVFSFHDDGPWTWLEIQKPGELTSLRGGQTLAKIVRK